MTCGLYLLRAAITITCVTFANYEPIVPLPANCFLPDLRQIQVVSLSLSVCGKNNDNLW